jgi:ABC-2 type transport system ATP-binding protein
MRQRAKVAAALVTDPEVLVLDEPLNGADPVQRLALIELFQRLGAAGRTVVVSSHVLHEVERLAERIVVVVHGRLAAAGDHRSIRDAMADRPRRVLLRSDDDRRLATGLLGLDQVVAVELGDAGVTISTGNAGELALALPGLSRRLDVRLREVRALDASLDSVFADLTSR